jgi:hypothetical protein
MKEEFSIWCSKRTCTGCKYEYLESTTECRIAYEVDNGLNINILKRIEDKIDIFMKHFNIKLDDKEEK